MNDTDNNSFEVHISRRATFFFLAIPALFIIAGIVLFFAYFVGSPNIVLTNQPLFVEILGFIFFGLVPIIIIYKQIKHLINPPIMLRVDKDFVSFGSGMSYKPYKIPTKYLLSVGAGLGAPSTSTIRPEQFVASGGVRLKFEKHKDVPFGKITSAGIVFQNHNLTISRIYADKSITKMIEGIRPFIKTSEPVK